MNDTLQGIDICCRTSESFVIRRNNALDIEKNKIERPEYNMPQQSVAYSSIKYELVCGHVSKIHSLSKIKDYCCAKALLFEIGRNYVDERHSSMIVDKRH